MPLWWFYSGYFLKSILCWMMLRCWDAVNLGGQVMWEGSWATSKE